MNANLTTHQLAGYGRLLRLSSRDERLNASHISMFTGLFVHWQRCGYASSFAITRRSVMAYSRIASIATYHKCIKDLHEFGYIRYQPSYHPKAGSRVCWPAGWQISVNNNG
ncbi:hypothetical protein FFF34_002605 [Inquilinus sp. KBS0705]|nr:hypothetical protein FFF34_002605 [Inquilinus sp. KBS0705]